MKLNQVDENWIKRYCRRKFRARHPDYDCICQAIACAYQQGVKAGEERERERINVEQEQLLC